MKQPKPFSRTFFESAEEGAEILSLRTGKRVKESDVGLAYYHSNELSPDENVQVLDLVGSQTYDSIKEAIMYPDKDGVLNIATRKDPSGVTYMQRRPIYNPAFVLSDKFEGSQRTTDDAYFYRYVAQKYHRELNPGSTARVQVLDSANQVVSKDEYKVEMSSGPSSGIYRLTVYFKRKPAKGDAYYLRYFAPVGDGEEEVIEIINMHPTMQGEMWADPGVSSKYKLTYDEHIGGYEIKVPPCNAINLTLSCLSGD